MNDMNLDELIMKLGNSGTERHAKRKEEVFEHLIDGERMEAILALCQSKAEEFALYGYDKVSKEEIWQYFQHRYKKELPPLHRLVNEILGLKITAYMNWITINAYKGV